MSDGLGGRQMTVKGVTHSSRIDVGSEGVAVPFVRDTDRRMDDTGRVTDLGSCPGPALWVKCRTSTVTDHALTRTRSETRVSGGVHSLPLLFEGRGHPNVPKSLK